MNDPIAQFQSLFTEAKTRESADATACALATVDGEGHPSVRIVLLKSADASGFTFYTNYESRKSAQLTANPHAALCFHWPTLGVQVRVEGTTQRVTAAESDEYFASRPRESQLGAWASRQSRPVASREELMEQFHQMEKRFSGAPVPRPETWGGYRLIPERIELWWSRPYRLHDRFVYERTGHAWTSQRLYP